jgi:hypothetical protein
VLADQYKCQRCYHEYETVSSTVKRGAFGLALTLLTGGAALPFVPFLFGGGDDSGDS